MEQENRIDFYGNLNPAELVKKYGSPLYVYNEGVLRDNCKKMKGFISYKNLKVYYSVKANGNSKLLEIIRNEGLFVDAMSLGEIFVEKIAGFNSSDIFFVSNNISKEEMLKVIDQDILISVDSISQLEMYGKLNPGGKVAIRFNPEIGTGHHKAVITAGKNTKFGIMISDIGKVKGILVKYNLRLVGINHHVGSLFLDGKIYIEAAKILLEIAKEFNLEFVDFGGGFGIDYRREENNYLDLKKMGSELSKIIEIWNAENNKEIEIRIEPGRYIVANTGTLLGTITAIKENYGKKYIGTDIGFNVFSRKVLYESNHRLELYSNETELTEKETVIVVGNICESGDVLRECVKFPKPNQEDVIGVLDAGAYGFSMSSNYNNRFRPAEVLIDINGKDRLIRRRETEEDLIRCF